MAQFTLAQSSYPYPLAVPPDDTTIQVGGLGAQIWNNPVSSIPWAPGSQLETMLLNARNGDVFNIREEVKFNINPYNLIKIDADFQYYKTKYKLGNWQWLDNNTGAVLESGFLNYPETIISREYQYVTYSPNVEKEYLNNLVGDFQVSWCQFDLAPAIVPNDWLMPVPPLTPGWRPTKNVQPSFFGKLACKVNINQSLLWLPWALNGRTSYQQIGMFLYPGCSIESIDWRIVGVNRMQGITSIPTPPPYLDPIGPCDNPIAQTCPALFQQFLADNLVNGTYPDLATCEGSIPVGIADTCALNQWICPTDPSQVFPYYQKVGGGT